MIKQAVCNTNMECLHRVMFKAYVLFVFLVSTKGSVTITTPIGGNAVIIGRTLTLKCNIAPLLTEMTWNIPGAGGACYCPAAPGVCHPLINDTRLSCSSDTTNGDFTLTLTNVTMKDEGTYRCRYGAEGTSFNVSVQVPIVSVDLISPATSPVTVKENKTIAFVCMASEGKPNARILWYMTSSHGTDTEVITGGITSTLLNGSLAITSSTLQYSPTRRDHEYRVYCTAYNIDENSTLISSNKPQLDVQYVCQTPSQLCCKFSCRSCLYYDPPSMPTFTVQGHPVSGSVSVIEGRDVSVRCSSSGNPPPGYTWTPRGSSTSADTLTLTNVTISDHRDYTCEATNTMITSTGAKELGSNRATFNLNVMYAPTVNSLQNDTTVENSKFSKTCTYTPGNPITTMVEWATPGGTVVSGQTLAISQVSKDSAGRYTCTAKNTMTPTGENAEDGTHSQTFQLSVFYSASITAFIINSQSGTGSLTVNENSTISLRCKVDGNPGSHITLTSNDAVLRTQENTTESTHDIHNITCSDAGTYSCTAKNDYNINNIPDASSRQIFVMCPPRPFNTEYNLTYFRTLNGNVTLNIEFTAYPAPSAYRWYQQQPDSNWADITVGVSSSVHHASLTIQKIKQADFGQYRVGIVNTLGTLEHLFFVAAQGAPDTPSRFSIIGGLEVPTFFWVGGFNGGYKQTFIIEVSPAGRTEWTQRRVVDEDDQNHVLPNGLYIADIGALQPGSHMARILSKNVLGISNVSMLLSFTVHQSATVQPVEAEQRVSLGVIAAVAVAGVEAIVIVAILIVLVIRQQRTRKDTTQETTCGAKSNQQEERQANTQDSYTFGSDSVSTYSTEEQQPNVYEKINPELKTDGVYDKVDKHDNRNQGHTSPEYINLNQRE